MRTHFVITTDSEIQLLLFLFPAAVGISDSKLVIITADDHAPPTPPTTSQLASPCADSEEVKLYKGLVICVFALNGACGRVFFVPFVPFLHLRVCIT